MAKMREFFFWNDNGLEEKTEQISLKKAVKSIQSKFLENKDKIIGVEYISKKGQKISEGIQLPWGRKKKLGR